MFKNKSPEELQNDPKYQELVKERKFWSTQPVLETGKEILTQQGSLETKKPKELIG